MACRCEICGKPAACGERYCDQCFIDYCCQTNVEKNLYSGGRFYGEKLENNEEINS